MFLFSRNSVDSIVKMIFETLVNMSNFFGEMKKIKDFFSIIIPSTRMDAQLPDDIAHKIKELVDCIEAFQATCKEECGPLIRDPASVDCHTACFENQFNCSPQLSVPLLE